jgi:hypothetical protein
VTIDLGNGRRLERTITGNSLHVVLDSRGRPVDALPGLFAPDVFRTLLVRAHATAAADRGALPAAHRRWLRQPIAVPTRPDGRAVAASRLAASKHVVEAPLLRALTYDVDADTAQNLQLHARIHERFASGVESTTEELVDWIYRDLFLMPADDPALGLDVPDPFLDVHGFAPMVLA